MWWTQRTLSGASNWDSIAWNYNLGWKWIISDRTLNDFTFGISRDDNKIYPAYSMEPERFFPSAILGATYNSPQDWAERNIAIRDNFYHFIPQLWGGEHDVKAGFELYRSHFYGHFGLNFRGTWHYAEDPTDWDDPSTYPKPFLYRVGLGDPAYDVVNPIISTYIQDDWTVTPKLTLNLGLRYDVEIGALKDNSWFRERLGEEPRVRTDADNFAPRLGFAYDLQGNGDTIIRGGAGLYYDQIFLDLTMEQQVLSGYRLLTVSIPDPDPDDPLQGRTFEDFLAGAGPLDVRPLSEGHTTPSTLQFSLGIARRVTEDIAFTADYVHIRGYNETNSRDTNLFYDPETGGARPVSIYGRPDDRFGRVWVFESSGHSQYDGLQVGFTKRYTNNFQIAASYILSRSYNTGVGAFDMPDNQFDMEAEYGPAANDQRHRLVVNWVYDLPLGFQLSGIFFTMSGRRYPTESPYDSFGDLMTRGDRTLPDGTVLPKNDTVGDPTYKVDLRITKFFTIKNLSIELIAEAFNLFNRTNFGNYGTMWGTSVYQQPIYSSTAFYQNREVQIGFRVSF